MQNIKNNVLNLWREFVNMKDWDKIDNKSLSETYLKYTPKSIESSELAFTAFEISWMDGWSIPISLS